MQMVEQMVGMAPLGVVHSAGLGGPATIARQFATKGKTAPGADGELATSCDVLPLVDRALHGF